MSVAFAALGATPAHGVEAFDLRYEAGAGCPPRDAFVGAVRSHTSATPPAGYSQRYSVTLWPGSGHARGRLEVSGSAGTSLAREVEAATCDEVATALAFITALSLDPNATRGVAPAPTPTVASTPEPSWAVGADAGASGAIAPTTSWGGAVFAEHVAPPGLGPNARLAAEALASPAVDAGPGRANFLLVSAMLEACPYQLAGGPLRAFACAGLELGALRGRGGAIAHPLTATERWTSMAAGARVELALGGPLFVDAGLRAIFPLTTPSFVFDDPRAVAQRVPHLAAAGALGVGAYFR